MKRTILIVDDDESLREVTAYHLSQEGYVVLKAKDGSSAIKLFEEATPDVVISDIVMPGMDGIQLLRKVMELSNTTKFILITAHGSVESAVQAMKLGAYDYIEKPFSSDMLKAVVSRALRVVSLESENRNLRQVAASMYSFGNLTGTSKKMVDVYRIASQIALSDSTVLIQGESGTGKELLARAIHFNSNRKESPFVAINVGAIPDSLVDSELFGHEKGSFTGAVSRHIGAFERACGGTLFLDEITDMRPDHQVRLLRVLQEKEIQRVGGEKPIATDVRIISASNRNVELLAREGEFREDLFYRLCVVPVFMPPLRERREDIPLLSAQFLEKYRPKDSSTLKIDDNAMEALFQYNWPGNVRELENVIQRCIIVASTNTIKYDDLPENIRRRDSSSASLLIDLPEGGIILEDLEKDIIKRALKKNDMNQSKTARYLGITRNTLLYRMEKFDLK